MIWFVGAAAALLYFLPKLQLGKRAIFLFRGIKFSGKKLQIKLGVQNPTNSAAILKSFTGEIFADKKLIANISNFQSTTINPRSETILNFDVSVSAAGLISTLAVKAKQIFQKTADKKLQIKKPTKTKIELKGTANVDNIILPVELSETI